MISDQDKDFIRLLLRSKDTGDGWRNVSKQVWPLVEQFGEQRLLEKQAGEDGSGKVRLTDNGQTVAEYLL